jgi:hypothetical protein
MPRCLSEALYACVQEEANSDENLKPLAQAHVAFLRALKRREDTDCVLYVSSGILWNLVVNNNNRVLWYGHRRRRSRRSARVQE